MPATRRLTEAFLVLHTWDNAEAPTPEKSAVPVAVGYAQWMEKERDEAIASAWVILEEARRIAEAA